MVTPAPGSRGSWQVGIVGPPALTNGARSPMSDLSAEITGKTIAVLGGTGPQGRGLARRFAQAGLRVVLGSRSAERAQEIAATLAEATGGEVSGAANVDAATAGDIVLVVVPWDGHAELLRELAPALAG